jgi:predicted ABC-type ATPase
VNPALLVIAGPNGAGKTTVTVRLREERWSDGVEYLNADDIAQQRFGGWNAPESVLAAARWTTERREELLATRAGIAFETVLSAPDKLDFLSRAKRAGYFVRVFFIGCGFRAIVNAKIGGW